MSFKIKREVPVPTVQQLNGNSWFDEVQALNICESKFEPSYVLVYSDVSKKDL
jgi:hypothetical protein